MPIRTHYDNLHISQDADAETIRTAYRRLSKQYHPDLNTDPDAHRIMQLINQAYEVLSNPESRAEHDRWIAQQNTITPTYRATPIINNTPIITTPIKKNENKIIALSIIFAVCAALILLGWQIWQVIDQKKQTQITTEATTNTHPISSVQTTQTLPETPQSDTDTIASTPQTLSGSYIRPPTTPNGNPWPQDTTYLEGYPISYGQGSNHLYVDNVRNSSDVYAELTHENSTTPLRVFFIRERSQIILDRLDAGSYTIRYRQLDAGEELLSEHVQIGNKQKEATVYLQRGRAPVE